jgi:undecaprenyl-diphosphatase
VASMLTYAQAFILGLLQGLTELFPISSLGHSVLIPALLNWQVDEHAEAFVLFLIATHLATALVLLAFFWRDWVKVIGGFFRLVITRTADAQDTYARLAWLIIVATIPAGLIGLIFQNKIESLFAAPKLVAIVLVLNGLLLYGIELTKRRRMRFENLRNTGDAAIVKLSSFEAAGAGLMQALALIPGFSRTGSSLGGGLLAGLDHESAARFSFLLATPIILAASVLKLPELFHAQFSVLPILFGSVVAAVAAFFALAFLVRYFKTNTLVPFAWYCMAVGALSFIILLHS